MSNAGDQHHDDRHHQLTRVLPESQQDDKIAQGPRDEGDEEGVEQPLQCAATEEPVQKPHRETADARAQGVQGAAAEEQGEGAAAEQVSHHGVQFPKLLLPGRQVDGGQPFRQLVQAGHGLTDLPGQGVELLQAGKVVGIGHDAHPAVFGVDLLGVEYRRQRNEGQDGEHLHPRRPVAFEDAVDRVLHPAHLAAAEEHPLPDVQRPAHDEPLFPFRHDLIRPFALKSAYYSSPKAPAQGMDEQFIFIKKT